MTRLSWSEPPTSRVSVSEIDRYGGQKLADMQVSGRPRIRSLRMVVEVVEPYLAQPVEHSAVDDYRSQLPYQDPVSEDMH